MAARRVALAALVLLAAAAAAASVAQADFAAATGFSGRNGFTCISCHVPPPLTALAPEATLHVEGLPDAWELGARHLLTIRVEGGPMALPPPAPRGGFEIDTDAGAFAVPPGMEPYLRHARPHLMTYTPEGTLLREWQVEWVAPDLAMRPGVATFWAAGVSANGNHNAELNLSTGGEHGDRTASVVFTVPPSPSALDAWRELPLLPPAVDAQASRLASGGEATVEGRHADGNATHLAWRLGDGEWDRRETAAGWRIVLPGLAPGEHLLVLRSEGAERISPEVEIHIEVEGGFFAPRGTPALPTLLLPAALLLTAALLRRPR